MVYTLTQVDRFLALEGRLERQRLAQQVGIYAVAAQGDRQSIEQLQRELLQETACDFL